MGSFVTAVALVLVARSHADEGMWLFTNPPTKILGDRYGFAPDAQWLEHVQKSAIRFNSGGSGSFVSANGLALTNHHVASGMIEKLSSDAKDLLATGFYAKRHDEELKCPGLEANVLWNVEDVTDRVKDAGAGLSVAEANTARREAMATIEEVAETATGLDCQVVTLYGGAQYHLYQYKRFTDVRLVMAPEQRIAFYGGENGNFEYPRYALDVCFLRVYENGEPYRTEHCLTWSRNGAEADDLVFVAGHPGHTQRLDTVANLKFLRDAEWPLRLQRYWRTEVKLETFSLRSDEFARIGRGQLFGVRNGRKAGTGILSGLQDPELMAKKLDEEDKLRAAVAANPTYQADWGDAWDEVASALEDYREYYVRHQTSLHSYLYGIAASLVRLADEKPKPNAERLPEYTDANLDSVYLHLFSPRPVYDALEIEQLESGLSYLMETFGGDDPYAQKALGGMSPRARAESLVYGTQLDDIAVRKQLAEGGARAIAASTDPMIRLAIALDPDARAWRKKYEDKIESVLTDAYANIAAAHVAINGASTYPDATFTLRLAFGTIEGYEEDGRSVPPYTTFTGLYERASKREGESDYALPQRWIKARRELNGATPYDFVCTADITGGNSGSPVVNENAEVVGVIFDSNIYGLVHTIAYTQGKGRAIAVDTRAIVEALAKVYNAKQLVKELLSDK